ncbi:MAG: hypothetical protein WC260_03270 [Candidatus Pacearchaeota archaeon]
MAKKNFLEKIRENKPLAIFIAVIGIVIVFFVAWYLLNLVIMPLIRIAPEWGSQVTAAAVEAPDFLVSLFGEEIFASWNSLIVFIAIFLMLLFALADMISSFSTFKKGTSWILAFGLGVIGVFTGVINKMIVSLFGGAATIGAIGIALIVIWAIVVAVFTNFIIGFTGLRELMKESKKKKNAMAGVKAVGSNLRTAYQVNKEISDAAREIGEEENKGNK